MLYIHFQKQSMGILITISSLHQRQYLVHVRSFCVYRSEYLGTASYQHRCRGVSSAPLRKGSRSRPKRNEDPVRRRKICKWPRQVSHNDVREPRGSQSPRTPPVYLLRQLDEPLEDL